MIRIAIAEDQALIRESLAVVLGLDPDVEVCWTAANGLETLRRAAEDMPDILLIDLRMPEMDGVTAMRKIRQELSAAGQPPLFIVLTTFNHDEWLMEAIHAGAAACFLKEVPPKLLLSAIRSVLAGTWEPASWHSDWRQFAPPIQFQARVSSPVTDGGIQDALTSRELEILCKMCEGSTNGEIAASLFLSEGTVKNYVSMLYAKLGVHHRTEAVKIARERGIYAK